MPPTIYDLPSLVGLRDLSHPTSPSTLPDWPSHGILQGMKQAIAGVVPPEVAEVTSAVVWPSIGAYGLGRWVGRVSGSRVGYGFFRLGKLMALATIPFSLGVYAWKILPFICRRYRLTNRRIIIQKGYSAQDEKSVGLGEFDAIEVRMLPGQEWLRCGDLVLLRGGQERLRLPGVVRPEVFRHICLEGQTAFISVGDIVRRQAAEKK